MKKINFASAGAGTLLTTAAFVGLQSPAVAHLRHGITDLPVPLNRLEDGSQDPFTATTDQLVEFNQVGQECNVTLEQIDTLLIHLNKFEDGFNASITLNDITTSDQLSTVLPSYIRAFDDMEEATVNVLNQLHTICGNVYVFQQPIPQNQATTVQNLTSFYYNNVVGSAREIVGDATQSTSPELATVQNFMDDFYSLYQFFVGNNILLEEKGYDLDSYRSSSNVENSAALAAQCFEEQRY